MDRNNNENLQILNYFLILIGLIGLSFIQWFAFEVSMGAMPNNHYIDSLPLSSKLGGCILVLLVIVIIYAFVGRVWMSSLLTSIFTIIISIINWYTRLLHGTFITYQDIHNFHTVQSVIGEYQFQLSSNVLFIVSLTICQFIIEIGLFYVEYKGPINHPTRMVRLCIIPTVFLVFYFIFLGSNLVMPDLEYRSSIWSWDEEYANRGFLLGSLEYYLTCKQTSFISPDNYSETSLYSIANELNADLIRYNTDIKATANESMPDIILILNETWYDMDQYYETGVADKYMGYYSSLPCVYKGYTYIPCIGGGTNLSEYEALTGNSVSLLNTYAPFNTLDLKRSHSLVEYLEELGYSTMAAHSESALDYNRRKAWQNLGFDIVHFQEDFKNIEYYGNRSYASDKSVFENMISMSSELPVDKPHFIFLLTMQNHGDWASNEKEYDEVVSNNKEGLSEWDGDRLDEYLSCIKKTDSAVRELIEYYKATCEESGRRTIIAMFGDHAPNFVLDMDDVNTEQCQENIKKRKTPYFIWDSGFNGIYTEVDMDLCVMPAALIETAKLPMSTYFLYLLKMRDSGIVCWTALNDFVGDYAGMNNYISFISDDETINYYLSSDYRSLQVDEYWTLEYSICSDKSGDNNTIYFPNL